MREPSRAEVREFIERQIRDWKTGWTNTVGGDKGNITDPNALRAIALLEQSLKLIPHLTRTTKKKNILRDWRTESSIVTAVKEAYNQGTKKQRIALRSWMKRALRKLP